MQIRNTLYVKPFFEIYITMNFEFGKKILVMCVIKDDRKVSNIWSTLYQDHLEQKKTPKYTWCTYKSFLI